MTTIKAWMSFLFSKIQKLTTELAAFCISKNKCLHFFAVAIDLTLFKLADKEEMYTILDVFEFWLDWATETSVTSVTCPYNEYKKTFT